MKKLLCLSLLLLSQVATHAEEIRPYTEADKDAVMKLAFQDPMDFFVGSALVDKGLMSRDVFEENNKQGMEALLADKVRVKIVIVEGDQVIGFADFFKTHEPSLESMEQQCAAQGIPFDQEQMLKFDRNIKKTDAECEDFVSLDAIVVDKDQRNKGYGKALMQEVENIIKEQWPTINRINLSTNKNNESAKKLYATVGFKKVSDHSPAQVMLAQMEIVQYEKTL